MSKRTRRTFSQEFKQQIVNLYLAGKPRVEIIREYELTASAFDKWVKQSKTYSPLLAFSNFLILKWFMIFAAI